MNNLLFEGDCLAVMPTLPSASVDLILCDLPYGITANRWDTLIDLEALWKEYRRLIKPRGVIALMARGLFAAKLILSNANWFKYKLIWVKSTPTNFLNANKQPLRKYEEICIFYQQQSVYNPQMSEGMPYDKGVRQDQPSSNYGYFAPCHVKSHGHRYPLDIIYFKNAQSEPESTVWHPTQKPVALGRYLIRTYSQPNDVVLDNAFGSGAFLLAAHLEDRRYCGIEKNEAIYSREKIRVDCLQVAKDRLEKHGGHPTIIRTVKP